MEQNQTIEYADFVNELLDQTELSIEAPQSIEVGTVKKT
jgi:hypothetical protein